MKRIVLFLILLSISSHSLVFANGDEHYIPITYLDVDVEKGTTHRSPTQIPIQAFYSSSSSTVYFYFLQNMGDVEVMILNSTTGELFEYDINSQTQFARCGITGSIGKYHLVIIVPHGADYGGEFAIY